MLVSLYKMLKEEYSEKKEPTTHDTLFADYLNNKRVVVVGPAPHMVGSNRGKEIDSYDVVVRVGKSLPVPKNLIQDIGCKTNVLYNPLNNQENRGGSINIEEWRKTLDFVASPNTGDSDAIKRDNLFLELNKGIIRFHPNDNIFYKKIEKIIESRLNTGFIAVLDVLRYNIKELYVVGFTFHCGAGNYYYKEYKIPHCAGESVHNPKKQLEMMKVLSDIDPRIKCDKELNQILKEHHLYFDDEQKEIYQNRIKSKIQFKNIYYPKNKNINLTPYVTFDNSYIKDFIKSLKFNSICEAGCGSGDFAWWLKKDLMTRLVFGIDFIYTANRPNTWGMAWYNDFLHDLRLQKNDVMFLTCFNTLNFVLEEDVNRVLEEFNRVTSQGLILKIPYIEEITKSDNFFIRIMSRTIKNKEWWIGKIKEYGNVYYIGDKFIYVHLYKSSIPVPEYIINLNQDENRQNIKYIKEMEKWQKSEQYDKWFLLEKSCREMPSTGDVAEFGVFLGKSLEFIIKSDNRKRNYFGFDSFEGMPPSDTHSIHKEGHWKVPKIPLVKNATLIKGFFKDTLISSKKYFEKLALIHMDADLYVSTKEALNYCLKDMQIGTIIQFDEIIGSRNNPIENEAKAWIEFVENNQIKYEVIGFAKNGNNGQVSFRITEIGEKQYENSSVCPS